MRFGRILFGLLFGSTLITAGAQSKLQPARWNACLLRKDGKEIPFRFDVKVENKKPVIYIVNAGERMRVDKLSFSKDSLFIEMPVFESNFRIRIVSAKLWQGEWIKGGSVTQQVMPFTAAMQNNVVAGNKPAAVDISGRWAITFTKGNEVSKPAIGEWQQKQHTLTGTILTPTGDYRYLSGTVNGDSLQLSTFDGGHAFLFTAKINSDKQITGGVFYSGATSNQPWIAEKNEKAILPDVAAMYARDADEKLNFHFRDLNGKNVSINDAQFKNKVVVIQIMGSWCPNCMDETAFLSDYYDHNKQRGVEIIGLAYEYSTDVERSKKSIEKFKKRFNVKYTLLNTGVTVTDSLRTEKTLPQLTQIKSFPSTIFLDKTGRVAKIYAGFEGPGTGEHYIAMKKEFGETVDRLLKE